MPTTREILDYFQESVFESHCAFWGWKLIAYSKSNAVLSDDRARFYVDIQKQYPVFFLFTERSFLMHFVIKVLHCFDGDSRSYSLRKVDESKTNDFIKENKEVIDMLYDLRDQLFAHRDLHVTKSTLDEYKIPSLNSLDDFFNRLFAFYNQLSAIALDKSVIFTNTDQVKHDIERLFQDLHRGASSRKVAFDIEFDSVNPDNLISRILSKTAPPTS